jgi:hypothetical protein
MPTFRNDRMLMSAACRMLGISNYSAAGYDSAVNIAVRTNTRYHGVLYHHTTRGNANSLYLIVDAGTTLDDFVAALEWGTLRSAEVGGPRLAVLFSSADLTQGVRP